MAVNEEGYRDWYSRGNEIRQGELAFLPGELKREGPAWNQAIYWRPVSGAVRGNRRGIPRG